MTSMPQLRVRTGFSFRNVFGSIESVADALEAAGTQIAAIVDDGGTWGHVQWEAELKRRGMNALFGFQTELTDAQGNAWGIGRNQAEFYTWTSSNPDHTAAWIAAPDSVVRFAGSALSHPDSFDYIDLNPSSLARAKRSLALHESTGKPLVLTGFNDYPSQKELAQFLAWADNRRATPQHILTDEDDWRRAFWWLSDEQYETAKQNTIKLAEEIKPWPLVQAPLIRVDGDLPKLVEEGIKERLALGHIKDWTDEYQARVERELDMIKHKKFESYFLVVADLVQWSKKHMLVGPARGSSAGSLVCYLLHITEVDPIPHGLLFERFIDINRDDLPDIDIDFNDKKRHLVFEYLAEKYGTENVARIGSINYLRPRSVIAHVGKKLGIPSRDAFAVTNVLIEYSSGDSRYGKGLEDTLENTQAGRNFLEQYPEGSLMGDLENHPSHTGVHAAGVIVSNDPVTHYCTVIDGVAQIDKNDAEHMNLLKIDALGLRTLGIIEDTGCVTAEELYALRHDDPAVLAIFDQAKFSGVFQFEGAAQRRVSIQVPMENFTRIDHVTALSRPGPLGGGAANHYINRNAGREQVVYRHPSMEAYLGETLGVVLYQEQVMRIVRELGDFSWEETSVIRKAMSGRKGKEFFDQKGEMFVRGAAKKGIDEASAQEIWNEICSFGAWGMNKSHTTSYAVISYWCAYMKCYHQLEYAAACLRGAKDNEQIVEILRELHAEGVPILDFDIDTASVDWSVANGKLVGGFKNLKGIGDARANFYIKKREAGTLTEEDKAKVLKLPVRYGSLFPAREMWKHLYQNPEQANVHGRIKEIGELEDRENAVIICKVVRRERRDENETVRLARRGGVRKEGQSQFLDLFVVDDTVSKPVLARIKSDMWEAIGEKIADRAVDGQDWFLIRGRWLQQFSMMSVIKIKCLTNKDMLS